eukprot:SAG31_NODE_735_length_12488_cov_7.086044_14_plen_55_part_00
MDLFDHTLGNTYFPLAILAMPRFKVYMSSAIVLSGSHVRAGSRDLRCMALLFWL